MTRLTFLYYITFLCVLRSSALYLERSVSGQSFALTNTSNVTENVGGHVNSTSDAGNATSSIDHACEGYGHLNSTASSNKTCITHTTHSSSTVTSPTSTSTYDNSSDGYGYGGYDDGDDYDDDDDDDGPPLWPLAIFIPLIVFVILLCCISCHASSSPRRTVQRNSNVNTPGTRVSTAKTATVSAPPRAHRSAGRNTTNSTCAAMSLSAPPPSYDSCVAGAVAAAAISTACC